MSDMKLFNVIEKLAKDINEITNSLISEIIFFEEADIKEIFNPSEDSAFLHLVSHLYGVFFERSRVNTKYIINHMDSFVGDSIFARKHLQVIHNLRTYYSHTLQGNNRNNLIKKECLMWFYENNVSAPPKNKEEWKILNNVLLNDSIKLLEDIKECLKSLGSDADFDFIKTEWIIQKTKDFPDHILEEMTFEICKEFALNIDAYKFIKINSTKIRGKLLIVTFENREHLNLLVKQYIEELLFTPNSIPCPVTGDDIKLSFDVKGKDLGEIKKYAIYLHNKDLYLNKEELIELLKEKFPNFIIRQPI